MSERIGHPLESVIERIVLAINELREEVSRVRVEVGNVEKALGDLEDLLREKLE
jgi:hypothetical protein